MISHLQMKYLLAVAQTGNITKAAQQLHISQPSLSNQIIALEKQLGISLLERRRKRVYLTDAGQYFATQSQKILNQEQNLEHTMEEFSQLKKGSLRLGLLPILCSLSLPEAVASFQKEYPQIRISLMVDGSLHLLKKLTGDDLDVIIAILEKDDLKKEVTALPLKMSTIYAAVHESHPLAAQPWIAPQQLIHESLIISGDSFVLQHIILKSMTDSQIFPEYSHKCNQIEASLALVDKNMGITFCSQEVASYYNFPHIVLRPLNPPITRTVYMVYRKQLNYFPLLKSFVNHIKEQYSLY